MTTKLAALAALLFLVLVATASATPGPLHRGSHGQRVKDLQWLLGGHAPSALDVATFPYKPNGLYGRRTARAVIAMKTRLGWPDRALRPVAGRDLLDVLRGKRARPLGYFTRATKRLARQREIEAQRADSACARRVIAVERAELGTREQPDGSNDGPRVRIYEAVTRAFRAPWCVSFQQWAFRLARVGFPRAWAGAIADDSAGVFYVAGWARTHGWLRAIPRPGYLVAFLDRLGHMGLIDRVVRGGFFSIEGNASNRVLERFHPFGGRPEVFVRVPGCAGG